MSAPSKDTPQQSPQNSPPLQATEFRTPQPAPPRSGGGRNEFGESGGRSSFGGRGGRGGTGRTPIGGRGLVPIDGGRNSGRGPMQRPPPVMLHASSGVPFGHVPAYLPGSASLVEELDRRILVVLRDGKHLIGVSRGVSFEIRQEEAVRMSHAAGECFIDSLFL